jgi:hypothetical protein
MESQSVLSAVLKLKNDHSHTWRDKPSIHWLRGLCEVALCGLHRHSPDTELRQIAAIALNWLEMRATTGKED